MNECEKNTWGEGVTEGDVVLPGRLAGLDMDIERYAPYC